MSQSVPIPMVGLECPTCALAFAVPRALLDIAVAEQRTLSCPQGHAVQFGRPAHVDQVIAGLEAQVKRLQGEVVVEQTLRRAAVERVCALMGETATLRRTIVDLTVGQETAHD